MNIYIILFQQPLLNLLVWLHNIIPGNDFGWSIVALTVIIKIILWPLNSKALKSQKALQDIQPKVEELKNKYKDNKEQMGKAMLNLYKEQKVSPFSSCLPLLVQFPFLIAIFHILRDGIENGALEKLYPFVAVPGDVSNMFLGLFNLSEPSIVLAVLAGIAQFFQTKMLTHKRQPTLPGAKDEGMASLMNKQMLYFMPVLTVIIGATLPGGLSLYWLFNTLLTLMQQIFIFKDEQKTVESK